MLNMNFWFFVVVILIWIAAFALGAFAGREYQKEESELDSDMLEFWENEASEWEKLYKKENEEKTKWRKNYLDLKYKNEE